LTLAAIISLEVDGVADHSDNILKIIDKL